jgi:hypothetical protein
MSPHAKYCHPAAAGKGLVNGRSKGTGKGLVKGRSKGNNKGKGEGLDKGKGKIKGSGTELDEGKGHGIGKGLVEGKSKGKSTRQFQEQEQSSILRPVTVTISGIFEDFEVELNDMSCIADVVNAIVAMHGPQTQGYVLRHNGTLLTDESLMLRDLQIDSYVLCYNGTLLIEVHIPMD